MVQFPIFFSPLSHIDTLYQLRFTCNYLAEMLICIDGFVFLIQCAFFFQFNENSINSVAGFFFIYIYIPLIHSSLLFDRINAIALECSFNSYWSTNQESRGECIESCNLLAKIMIYRAIFTWARWNSLWSGWMVWEKVFE